MITLIDCLPEVNKPNAEQIKIRTCFEAYGSDGLFWEQDGGYAYISLIDKNMVIYKSAPLTQSRIEELYEFLTVIGPVCIFSDIDTLTALGRIPDETISVMHKKAQPQASRVSDCLSSKEIYDILNVEGLSLPDYEHFAVDFCYRLNHGMLEYFAIKNICAAISFHTGSYAIMNGIASHIKGYGSIALNSILTKNAGRDFLVCCRQKVKGFYQKNGFSELYKAGYWVKNR